MNGYNLLRDWYNFKFTNPSKVKAVHSDMYCYLIDLWNRLGQKEEFGLPTSVSMESLGIGSYNTYKKTLHDLIEFGFVKLILESKNQHQSKIVALSNFDKATDKATDKALDKATIKATDTIDKQINKETIEQYIEPFEKRMVKFLNWFNHEFTRYQKPPTKFRTLNKQAQDNLKKLFNSKYTQEEWIHAFGNMIHNQWVIDNKTATPDHFLRVANFEKYLNQEATYIKVKKFKFPHS